MELYERFERPLVRVLARMETNGIKVDREFLENLSADLGQQCDALGAADPRRGRRGVQRQLDAAAPHDPVREARSRPGEEDQDRTVDRRRLAAEDGAGPSDHRGPPALPRGGEAAQHLRRRAAAADRRRRPHPRDVQADRHHDRAHLERGAEPAERAGAHRRRPRDAPRLHRRGRLRASSPPTTRRSSCASSRTSPRTPASSTRSSAAPTSTPPPRSKVFGVPESEVDAAQRRFAKVVNYGLAYGMEAYGLGQRLDIPTGEAAEILDAYFEGFPNVKTFMEGTIQRGQGARVHHHASSVAAARSASCRRTTSASVRWGSGWRRTRRCRARPPTSSSWR